MKRMKRARIKKRMLRVKLLSKMELFRLNAEFKKVSKSIYITQRKDGTFSMRFDVETKELDNFRVMLDDVQRLVRLPDGNSENITNNISLLQLRILEYLFDKVGGSTLAEISQAMPDKRPVDVSNSLNSLNRKGFLKNAYDGSFNTASHKRDMILEILKENEVVLNEFKELQNNRAE